MMTPKLSKEFKLTEQTIKELHAHAMHFVTQYLRIQSSKKEPLFSTFQNLVNQPACQLLSKAGLTKYIQHGKDVILLERLTLQASILGLVLKVHF